MLLGSDNTAGASPAILDALARLGSAPDGPYGADRETAEAARRLRDVFECDLDVFPVISGTAANAISLAAVTRPYQAVACTDCAHILTSECGAPEFFSGGAKLVPLQTAHGRLQPRAFEAAIEDAVKHGVHHSQVAAVSLTQATEWGTVYRPAQIAELAEIAHRRDVVVQMDGARFANALVGLDVSPAAMTWRAGVDLLSFGATKNGALAAEAIVVFDRGRTPGIAERRKQSGHLLSKQRFVSAQLAAYLADDLWLRNATQANRMAVALARGLERLDGVHLVEPVEANEAFVHLPDPVADRLAAAGIGFYRWTEMEGGVIARMVCSFATTEAEVSAVLAAARG